MYFLLLPNSIFFDYWKRGLNKTGSCIMAANPSVSLLFGLLTILSAGIFQSIIDHQVTLWKQGK